MPFKYKLFGGFFGVHLRVDMTRIIYIIFLAFFVRSAVGQARPFSVRLAPVPLASARWTGGFWADRFSICRDSLVPHLWAVYTDPAMGHALQNFAIAAHLAAGVHVGPPFQDGDFYKLLEAMAAEYAVCRDRSLDSMMDRAIYFIARAQRADGYIHTPTQISGRVSKRLDFEAYNMGHLMTAACVHFAATGKTTLLTVAERAADYMLRYDRAHPGAMALNNICPSHYMGLVALYRVTGRKEYLSLADRLIRAHGAARSGTDQNQDRVPFLRQTVAVGHAVRANYLYAGAADVYACTGSSDLLPPLLSIWSDISLHKLYVTGGCGALYDGVSPMGTAYDPAVIQTVHQAYGADYQLPNTTAHNETCAAVGALLWNWRMFLVTGAARYMDMVELELYNGILSGVSLSGTRYSYTNPLRVIRSSPDTLRWSGPRVPYISLSDCCPPNVARTLAEASGYAYATSPRGVWVNLYGSSEFSYHGLRLRQTTSYPWDGRVVVSVLDAPPDSLSLFLRMPGWCTSPSVSGVAATPGSYVEVRRRWVPGDSVVISLPMPVVALQANPLVEADLGQIAVKRGPVVYCLESVDAPSSILSLAVDTAWRPTPTVICGDSLVALSGTAQVYPSFSSGLYAPVSSAPPVTVPVRLVPYFAWGNRGAGDMTVWMRAWRP